jgi:hypothetical protein
VTAAAAAAADEVGRDMSEQDGQACLAVAYAEARSVLKGSAVYIGGFQATASESRLSGGSARTMWCADAPRDTVPVASNDERPLQDSRRPLPGRAEGE